MSKTPFDGTEAVIPPAGGLDTYESTPFASQNGSDNYEVCEEIAKRDAAAIAKFNQGTLSNG
jgi:hypothetical protein